EGQSRGYMRVSAANEPPERKRGGGAPSERGCRGVRGRGAGYMRVSAANEPPERKRGGGAASERVCRGVRGAKSWIHASERRERATGADARRRSAERARV